MSKTFVFPSIARPSWRYRLYNNMDDNPSYNWRHSGDSLSYYISQYDTMGDGEVQHCADCRVAREDIGDVLASLRLDLHRLAPVVTGTSVEINRAFDAFWDDSVISDDSLALLLSLKPSTYEKPQYVSFSEGKKSAGDSKRHDKRWFEVPRMDSDKSMSNSSDRLEWLMMVWGTENSERRLSLFRYIGNLLKICRAEFPKDCPDYAASMYLKRGKHSVFEGCDTRELIHHYDAIQNFYKAIHSIRWTVESCGRLREQMEWQREHDAKQAAEVVSA